MPNKRDGDMTITIRVSKDLHRALTLMALAQGTDKKTICETALEHTYAVWRKANKHKSVADLIGDMPSEGAQL